MKESNNPEWVKIILELKKQQEENKKMLTKQNMEQNRKIPPG